MKRARIASAAELARRVHIKVPTVRSHVNGTRGIPKDTAQKYARALGIKPADIYYPAKPSDKDNLSPPISDNVQVPHLDIQFAAGDGFYIDREKIKGYWPFSRSFLAQLGVGANARLAMVDVRGDSMEPTLREGDAILVNMSDTSPDGRGIFILLDDELNLVKRLEKVPFSGTPKLSVISDNPQRRAYERPAKAISIQGRVVWFGRRL